MNYDREMVFHESKLPSVTLSKTNKEIELTTKNNEFNNIEYELRFT